MKRFVLLIACAAGGWAVCLIGGDPDPNTAGSHAHLLQYDLVFSPAPKLPDAHLIATLKNSTKQTLKVRVNPEAFQGSIEIEGAKGTKVEAFEKSYRTLLLTSEWSVPVIELKAGQSIQWRVPLKAFVTLHDQQVTDEQWNGNRVRSEITVAVVPRDGNYLVANATQNSEPISIPRYD